jgi:flagellar biosynthesis/type III secretory pathway M-ring protein FliF/YscJ
MPILLAASDGTSVEIVPIVAVTMTFVWLIVKALMAPFTQRAAIKAKREENQSGGLSEEEHASLQNLQRTLSNMERRVESLETILIETQRAKENYGSKL